MTSELIPFILVQQHWELELVTKRNCLQIKTVEILFWKKYKVLAYRIYQNGPIETQQCLLLFPQIILIKGFQLVL